MKFCTDHWQRLQQAVKEKGLDALVPEGGDAAGAKMIDQARNGVTVDNFDPLMGAHNAIVQHAMTLIRNQYQQNALMLMSDDPHHPEWACPICALNWCHIEHNRTCVQVDCNWPQEFDWTDEMVNGSTDIMVTQWRTLNANC